MMVVVAPIEDLAQVMKQFHVVIEYTQNCVKINSKFTNLKIKSRIE